MRIVGAPSRLAGSSPTTSGGWSPFWTSSPLPPAASIRRSAQPAASTSASGLPPAVLTDGMRSQSPSSASVSSSSVTRADLMTAIVSPDFTAPPSWTASSAIVPALWA